METWQARRFRDVGIDADFVQDNFSHSSKGTLRGLHYQIEQPQAKLVRVVSGEIFDVAVDIQPNSPTRGQWVAVLLSAENRKQMYIPGGFAHGFCVTSKAADVLYKVTSLYTPDQDHCIVWNDPDIAIQWPVTRPIVSSKDARGMRFKDLKIY